MLGGWDSEKPAEYQPFHRGPVYERIAGGWVEKCPMETNFKAEDIIYIESIKGKDNEPTIGSQVLDH